MSNRFNPAAIIERLAAFPDQLRAVATPLNEHQWLFKPKPDVWSILEICAHLHDEEREDFRARLRSTLEDPTKPWPSLELENVAQRREYHKLDPAKVLDAFARERAASVEWLRALPSPDWHATYTHPARQFQAGDLLVSWRVHDLAHLRQITQRLIELANHEASPFSSDYAF